MRFLWWLFKYNVCIFCLVVILFNTIEIRDGRWHFLIMLAWCTSHAPALISYLQYGDWLKVRIKFGGDNG